MALAPYTANANDASQPTDLQQGGVAARELRALKQKCNELQTSVRPTQAAGTANALTVASFPSVLTAGRVYYVLAAAANTGAVTLTPGSGSPISIRQSDGTTELAAGMIQAGQLLVLHYTGTVLKQVAGGGIPSIDPGFNFSPLTWKLTYLGENSWMVALSDGQVAVYSNVYFDGTDLRYIANGVASIRYLTGQQEGELASFVAGVAGAIVAPDAFQLNDTYLHMTYTSGAGTTNIYSWDYTGPLIVGKIYRAFLREGMVPPGGSFFSEPTLAGKPIFMQRPNGIEPVTGALLFAPVFSEAMQKGSLIELQYAEDELAPDGCFIILLPPSGLTIRDSVLITATAPYFTALTTKHRMAVELATDNSIVIGRNVGGPTRTLYTLFQSSYTQGMRAKGRFLALRSYTVGGVTFNAYTQRVGTELQAGGDHLNGNFAFFFDGTPLGDPSSWRSTYGSHFNIEFTLQHTIPV